MSMLSYIVLKLNSKFRHIERPYKSPLSIVGAVFAIIISLLIMISFVAFDETGFALWGVLGAVLIYIILGIEFKINGIARLQKHEESQNDNNTSNPTSEIEMQPQ